MDFVFHVSLQDHMIKVFGYRHGGSEDVIILVYHVISQKHVIKRLRNFMWSSLSR